MGLIKCHGEKEVVMMGKLYPFKVTFMEYFNSSKCFIRDQIHLYLVAGSYENKDLFTM